jgi:hypothetical protein
VDDTWIQSPFIFCLFYPENACPSCPENAQQSSQLEERQIPDNNAVRLAKIWQSACIRHIAEEEPFRQNGSLPQ